jgi:hypothetical protein
MHHPLFVNQRSNLMEDGAVNIYLILFFFLIKIDVLFFFLIKMDVRSVYVYLD